MISNKKTTINYQNETIDNSDILSMISCITDDRLKNNLIDFISKVVSSANSTSSNEAEMMLKNDKNIKKIYVQQNENNLHYIATFSKYINKIDSDSVKDKIIDFVKSLAK